MSRKRILLLGADGVAGLNYVKCLRLKFDDEELGIVGTTMNRYRQKAYKDYFDDLIYIDQQIDETYLKSLVEKYDISFIHAQPEEEVKLLCNLKNPDLQKLVKGKNEAVRAYCEDKLKIQRIFLGDQCFSLDNIPINLESGDYWIRYRYGAGSQLALRVQNVDQMMNWSNYLMQMGKIDNYNELMVAPYLPGEEYAVQILYNNEKLVHCQQRERVEHHFSKQMVSGTSSTPSVARITNWDDVYEIAEEALYAIVSDLNLGKVPDGIYGVDLRRDKFGDPIVTEINYGRYFTTSLFFATCGVNSPVAELTDDEELKYASVIPDVYWVRSLDEEPIYYYEWSER